MKKAEDLVTIKQKPHNSILPYLRAKEAEKAEEGKKPASPKTDEIGGRKDGN